MRKFPLPGKEKKIQVKHLTSLFVIFFTCSSLVCQGACLFTVNDVIRETLENQWAIKTSELVIQTDLGLVEQATGAFNVQLNASLSNLYQFDLQSNLGLKSDFNGGITSTTVMLQKLTRMGTLYSLNYINTNTRNRLTIPLEPPRTDRTIVSFTLAQPLLRNLWFSPQTILEKTQYLSFEASRLQNIQNIATAIATSLTAYWQVVGAKLILDAQKDLEEKLGLFAKYAEALVTEEQKETASLHQPYANLASAIVNRIQGEQNLIASYNNLLFAMGRVIEGEGDELFCGLEFEQFCLPEKIAPLDECCFETLRALIPLQRADLVSTYLLQESALLNLKSAQNSLLPQLNVVASTNFLNTNGGRQPSALYESFPSDRPQKEYLLGLTFSYPFCNDVARGLVRTQKAALTQSEINTDQLQSSIIANFNTAFTFNNALAKELQNARRAASEFTDSAVTEFARLQAGLSTYFDVLNLANDATSAKIQAIRIEILYIQNLINLYFLTGDLVKWHRFQENIDVVDFHELITQTPHHSRKSIPCHQDPQTVEEQGSAYERREYIKPKIRQVTTYGDVKRAR